MFNTSMFSSQRLDWKTPKAVYKELDKEFHFNFDPCPSNPSFDGLKINWRERNFVNPPYGREIGKWLKKGFEEWEKGKLVVFLIPSRTDTNWWHEYVMKANEIRFIRGRLKFDEYKNSAPFPSVIVIFNKRAVRQEDLRYMTCSCGARCGLGVLPKSGRRRSSTLS